MEKWLKKMKYIREIYKGGKCRRTCSICRINYDSDRDGEIMKWMWTSSLKYGWLIGGFGAHVYAPLGSKSMIVVMSVCYYYYYYCYIIQQWNLIYLRQNPIVGNNIKILGKKISNEWDADASASKPQIHKIIQTDRCYLVSGNLD